MRERFSAPVPFHSSDRFDAVLPSRIPLHEELNHTDLTLSVSAPVLSDAQPDSPKVSCPVVVYLHGGRFENGHADEPIYRGDAFARDGVVYVAVNYRKRLEGFLPLEEPVADDAAPASEFRGAQDVVCALRWVRDNIAGFGGDPTQVTVMGQSAGGGLLSYVLTMPAVKEENLIHRAVVMSPGLSRVSWKKRFRWAQSALRSASGVFSSEKNAWLNRITAQQLDKAYRHLAWRYSTDVASGPYPFHAEDMADVPLLVTGLEAEFDRMPVAAWADRKLRDGHLGQRIAARGVRALAARSMRAPRKSIARADATGRSIGNSTILRFVSQILERPRGAGQAPQWALFYRSGQQQSGSDYRPLAQHCADIPLVFDALQSNKEFAQMFCGKHAAEALQPLATELHRQVIGFIRGSDLPWEPYDAHGSRAVRVVTLGDHSSRVEPDALAHIREHFPPIPAYTGMHD